MQKKNSMFHNTEFEKKLTYYYLYDKNGIVYILLCIFEKKVFKTHKKKGCRTLSSTPLKSETPCFLSCKTTAAIIAIGRSVGIDCFIFITIGEFHAIMVLINALIYFFVGR